ncbi:MAG: hypothetical protein KR126chlam4_00018 [Candidatus Anoxychlamydiales bacterium]|uniref:Uncharacterized protein n=1 Tax=marine sediment metagenome TaxID=412755 RepID=A0A0F9CAN6_9ZZZZ|nr:hypothetical protein [Candidatus Anoxychlamydiales bacterium]NGX40201.1 hypothetical protein [Candidatus Anoxychlamydiales bacterium]HEU64243.1 hypothetical protein [Chlamydiota bacterium]
MLKTEYNEKMPYINSKEIEFRSVLDKKSFESLKRQAEVIATHKGKTATHKGKNGLSWTKDLDPKVTKVFQAVPDAFSSKDLLKSNEGSLSASFIAKNWTETLRGKIEKEGIQLKEEEIVLFKKVWDVFQTLLYYHNSKYKEMVLNKINTNCVALRNYEAAAKNLFELCEIQRSRITSAQNSPDQVRKVEEETPSAAIQEFLVERYGDDQSFKRYGKTK